ncbi:MAG TPA: hypothetical protein VGI10_13145 [Polyangiaceae bacterium]|jgi:hypothetical protein
MFRLARYGCVAALSVLVLALAAHCRAARPSPTAAPVAPPKSSVSPNAQKKLVFPLDVPETRREFAVAPDGRHIYMAADSSYYVFDDQGNLVRRLPRRGAPRSLALLKDGRFIAAESGASGRIVLVRGDGSEERMLVARGGTIDTLHRDSTGWTTPTGVAVDATRGLVFALDTTAAKSGSPDPEWSRIAVFDLAGKHARDLLPYDGTKMPATSDLRTWYDDIEVDETHQHVYVTARAAHELWMLDYTGARQGGAPGVAGIAVLPGGRVAVGDPDGRHIRIYDSSLGLQKTLDANHVAELEADAAGRLYASSPDATMLFERWSSTLTEPTIVHPAFQQLAVDFPHGPFKAGASVTFAVEHIGKPEPLENRWQALTRPENGSNLRWTPLATAFRDGKLSATLPAEPGPYELLVRSGSAAFDRSDIHQQLYVENPIVIEPAAGSGSVSIVSTTGRRAFVQGETIPLAVVVRGTAASARHHIALRAFGQTLATLDAPDGSNSYFELTSDATRRLAPGQYELAPLDGSDARYPLNLEIAQADRDSPLQRILYHEFDLDPVTAKQTRLENTSERLAFIRDYLDALKHQGFSRETDRMAANLGDADAGNWQLAAVNESSAPPRDYFGVPSAGQWEHEAYLDGATARGIHYDTQLLAHCSGVRLAENWFSTLNPELQRATQRLARYPAFYGFNYNDEAFFPTSPWGDSTAEDREWLAQEAKKYTAHPLPNAYRDGLTRMYGEFNGAVSAIRPDLARTATPMWQFPAVEGSYAPTIYAQMTESYSHYLSEGYDWPWYAAHSVDFLRRPQLPVMGVFDNGYHGNEGVGYMRTAMQVLGRGVQGVGAEHSRPFEDSASADAMRVMNTLAKEYGPIFAEAEPDNEGAILYSYTQDVTEKRHFLGTPHWERVLTLHGAALMAGLPMSIVYEEDIAAGGLLAHGAPRVPLLFLVGQKEILPSRVRDGINAFTRAGGRIATDEESNTPAGAERLSLSLFELHGIAQPAVDGDALFPTIQPAYERIAAVLHAALAGKRRLAVDSDQPWIAVNRFNGGDIRYVSLSAEVAPYPWDPGTTWSLGADYNRNYQPTTATLSIPPTNTVYDVFERRITPVEHGRGRDAVRADLNLFPGRLYALAPKPLGEPGVSVRVDRDSILYEINVGMHARVPLRLRLKSRNRIAWEVFRATTPAGLLEGSTTLPPDDAWQLEVSELLSGKTSSVDLGAGQPLTGAAFERQRDVEIEREAQIRQLTSRTNHSLRIVVSEGSKLTNGALALLERPLAARGIAVTVEAKLGPSSVPGSCIALGTVAHDALGAILGRANKRGLFVHPLTETYPGPGRGVLSAVFAPREYREDCVAIIGGDDVGLDRAVHRFVSLMEGANSGGSGHERPSPARLLQGKTTGAAELLPLRDQIGPHLTDIIAVHGKLAVSAAGLQGNLARIDDLGDHGHVVATARVGESPATGSLFLSADGQSFGASARTIQRFGEGFYLRNAGKRSDCFSSFGDLGRFQHTFAASSDATTVIAPGPLGVVAWQRSATGWSEAWAIDYWKQFDQLDWPVDANDERIPSFDALVPRNGQDALIAFGERAETPWVRGTMASSASVSARSLNDGHQHWRFSPPIADALLFPKLYANDDGRVVVLQIKILTSRGPSYRYYALHDGKLAGQWHTDETPLLLTLAHSGTIAAIYTNKLLELRRPDGDVTLSSVWHAQPVSLAFAENERALFVADDAGDLSRLETSGETSVQAHPGCQLWLTTDRDRVYGAGWDGRVRAFDLELKPRWVLDLTADLLATQPSNVAGDAHDAKRLSSASPIIPIGPNLLRNGAATLTVGGTPGWKSQGTVQVKAEDLVNGSYDDVKTPWLSPSEVFWDAETGRQVWAEIAFAQPTTVHTLSVFENPSFPDSWPTEAVIQIWSDQANGWKTAKHAVFLKGATNTYALDLHAVKRLRYVPWANYYRNFHTSEIEVR